MPASRLSRRIGFRAARAAEVLFLFSFLLWSYSYWWYGNISHELVGLAFFILVGRHVFVRFRLVMNYFLRALRERANIGSAFAHFCLVISIIVLFVSSLLISKLLGSVLPRLGGITARQVHWFAAYWLAVFVGVHIGLHWNRFCGLSNRKLHGWDARKLQSGFGVAMGLAIFGFGIWSVDVLGLVQRLSSGYSIKFWNFRESVVPFFAHWIGVIALAGLCTHLITIILADKGLKHKSSKI